MRLVCAGMIVLAAVLRCCSASVMDLEAVRDTLHMLIDNGNAIDEETLRDVAASYSGAIREHLDGMNSMLAKAKSPAEIYIINQQTDMSVTEQLLRNLVQRGEADLQLGRALFKMYEGPSSRWLQPHLTAAAGIADIKSLCSKIKQIVAAIEQLLEQADEDIIQQLQLEAGRHSQQHVKNFMTDLANTLKNLEKVEEESVSASASSSRHFAKEDAGKFKEVIDKAINKQTVKYISEMMQANGDVLREIDDLLARDLHSPALIDILKAIRRIEQQ